MKNCYVYIYLDPRKSGKYIYGNYCFLYEPFYVGKGTGYRLNELLRHNKFCKRKINKILNIGIKPIIIKLKENLSEKESFILESKLIKLIGRKDLNEGSLVNFTDGGEGMINLNRTEEHCKKISESIKGENHPMYGKKLSYDHRNKIRKALKGRKRPEYVKRKISKSQKGENSWMFGKKHSDEWKLKMSIKYKNTDHSNEIKKIIDKVSRYWKLIDSKGNEIIIKNLSEFCRKNKLNNGVMSNISKNGGTHKGWKCEKIGKELK